MNTIKELKTRRDSNMELLRIVSMLLVLVLHAGFKSLNAPTLEDVQLYPFSAFRRFFTEAASIVCLNVFVLISGWYAIRPKVKRFCAFIFQVLFIGLVIYLVLLALGKTEVWNRTQWTEFIFMGRGVWFVSAYIVLYVLSPILNYFAEHAPRVQFKRFLLAFFAVQLVFAFIMDESYFNNGYSPLSFIGLYMLARYARMYPNSLTTQNKYLDLCVYLALTLLTTCLAIIKVKYSIAEGLYLYAMSSPLIILSSFYFFLFFTKISFHSRLVNWIASSAFAVYLFHTDPLILEPYYTKQIFGFVISDSSIMFIVHSAAFILLVFTISILLDKVRIIVWELICKIGNLVRN